MGKIFPNLPTRESHVRALLALESDDDRAKVWEVVATSGESVTAKYIEEQVERFMRLYRDRAQIPQRADFTITEAYRLLSQP